MKHSFALFALLLSQNAFGYFSTIDTGDTLGANKYAVSIEPEFILDRYDGANFNARLDAGLNEDSNLRLIVGAGVVNFQGGAMYKYIPFPDTSNQPAIGVEAGAVYAHVQDSNELDLRVHPLVSKKITIEDVKLNVYGSIPFGFNFRSGTNLYPIQLTAGTEWKIPANERFSVFGEVGVNINSAFGYVSVAGMYYFDDPNVRH